MDFCLRINFLNRLAYFVLAENSKNSNILFFKQNWIEIRTRGFPNTGNTMQLSVFEFKLYTTTQGCKICKFSCKKITVRQNWLKIGTRGFFNTGNTMPLSAFEFELCTTTQRFKICKFSCPKIKAKA